MRAMIRILLLTVCLSCVSCRSARYIPLESRTDSIYIDRLLPYPLPPDSATIRALMECDEHGRVVLRWLDIANSKNAEALFRIDSLGRVIARMRTRRDTLYLPSKEIYVDRTTEIPVPVERELSRWERVKMETGGWAIGGLSILSVLGIVWLERKFVRG